MIRFTLPQVNAMLMGPFLGAVKSRTADAQSGLDVLSDAFEGMWRENGGRRRRRRRRKLLRCRDCVILLV